MKAFVALVLAIGLLAGCEGIPSPDKPYTAFQQARAATFALGAEREDGVKTFCTAVQIEQDKFLTAAHCVADDVLQYKPGVVDKNGVVHVFVVLRKNDVTDVALITAEVGDPHLAPLARKGAQLDESIIIVGYPLNDITNQQVLTTGRAGELRKGDPFQLAVAHATFGNSGGPVFVFRGGKVYVTGIMSQTTIINFYGFPNQHHMLAWFAPLESLKAILNAAS